MPCPARGQQSPANEKGNSAAPGSGGPPPALHLAPHGNTWNQSLVSELSSSLQGSLVQTVGGSLGQVMVSICKFGVETTSASSPTHEIPLAKGLVNEPIGTVPGDEAQAKPDAWLALLGGLGVVMHPPMLSPELVLLSDKGHSSSALAALKEQQRILNNHVAACHRTGTASSMAFGYSGEAPVLQQMLPWQVSAAGSKGCRH